VLAEAAIFAGPFQPRVPLAEDPPPSAAMAWLQTHAGDSAVAGQALELIPNLSTVYGLRDARGVDVTIDPRPTTMPQFWVAGGSRIPDAEYHDVRGAREERSGAHPALRRQRPCDVNSSRICSCSMRIIRVGPMVFPVSRSNAGNSICSSIPK